MTFLFSWILFASIFKYDIFSFFWAWAFCEQFGCCFVCTTRYINMYVYGRSMYLGYFLSLSLLLPICTVPQVEESIHVVNNRARTTKGGNLWNKFWDLGLFSCVSLLTYLSTFVLEFGPKVKPLLRLDSFNCFTEC